MKRSDVNSLETIEQYYNKNRKFKFNNHIKIESLEDIYDNLFIGEYKIEKIGGFLFDKMIREDSEQTYFKKGSEQCGINKYRSIDDFITISKNYFPKKEVKEIIKYLLNKEKELLKKDKQQLFRYCPSIRKYNYRGIQYSIKYSALLKDYTFNDVFPNFNKSIVELV